MPKDNYYAKEILEWIENSNNNLIEKKYIISKKKNTKINTNKFGDIIVINLYYLMDYFIININKYNSTKILNYLIKIDGNINNFRNLFKIFDYIPYYFFNNFNCNIDEIILNKKKNELYEIIKSENKTYFIKLPNEIIKYIIKYVFIKYELNKISNAKIKTLRINLKK